MGGVVVMTLIVIDKSVERQIAVFCDNINLRDKVSKLLWDSFMDLKSIKCN